ncbi:Piso0_002994 [Millerozyma farinosa CBS 7064]|uniref:Vacuolar protein sorting-associated protein 28 n=1 Tax=Pichia sorbitophila (strain ATCC MYA-4447 / BCRC 22081 / CBS 7064 / NBRC 10061 / NRRL Y-12695) TaxID=559304 RepID=G8YK22_PICSO|nr:Piso0_002994 [Millerozyma farinosa CBS 7064]CCE80667.1 Piso0_002994 [Millerozyma farinosa CBS 7064]
MSNRSTSIPPYAPTATTSYTVSSRNGAESLQEVDRSSLFHTPTHKVVYESLAEIHSILTVLEMLENAFLKDYITDKDKYTSTVLRLMNQYQIILQTLSNTTEKQRALKDILPRSSENQENLLNELTNTLDCDVPLAIKRIEIGMPATMEQRGSKLGTASEESTDRNQGSRTSGKLVAKVTGNFITCMDALKLNYRTKEQLHPLLSDLVVSLNDLTVYDTTEEGEKKEGTLEFAGKSKLISWLIKLNNLKDNELSQEEIETFLNDLDETYKNFYTTLE